MSKKPRRKKKIVDPEPMVGEQIPEPEPVVTVEPTPEPEPVITEPEPTTQEQIDKLLKEHPQFLGTPTMRYYGEVLYPWLHELEQLLE